MTLTIYRESDYNTGELNLLTMEKRVIIKALKKTKGNKTEAANLLQINVKSIHNKVKQHSINVNLYRKKKLKYE
jgi:DNA-binding NtrC family response regulator